MTSVPDAIHIQSDDIGHEDYCVSAWVITP